MKILHLTFYILHLTSFCFAQFPPPAGQSGTTAIHKDSSVFVSWANGCAITRGFQDISDAAPGYASAGDSTMALGIAGDGVVSLGDGGSAILTFENPLKNGDGWDFAVFENSFSDSYLELAFVEVSSDGLNFFRFPPTSNMQDTIQIDGFGSVDATKINNLAGKYRALYGTPFDLQELDGQSGLDINNITHVKIIDVVGCIQDEFATYDINGKKINDPWNTPFASSGFDLDAVGVIHQNMSEVRSPKSEVSAFEIFPNPNNGKFTIEIMNDELRMLNYEVKIYNLLGKIAYAKYQTTNNEQTTNLPNGIYFLQLKEQGKTFTKKIIVENYTTN